MAGPVKGHACGLDDRSRARLIPQPAFAVSRFEVQVVRDSGVQGLGLKVLGLAIKLGFGFRVPGSGFRVPGFGFGVSGVEFLVLCHGLHGSEQAPQSRR